MAKSLRSKVKQAAGRKRRSDSHYAVAEAERIKRISTKLMEKSKTAPKPAAEGEDEEELEDVKEEDTTMEGDAPEKKVSTSGPRGSRREEWRKSKGMSAKRESKNKGSVSGGSKSFKPKRRR